MIQYILSSGIPELKPPMVELKPVWSVSSGLYIHTGGLHGLPFLEKVYLVNSMNSA